MIRRASLLAACLAIAASTRAEAYDVSIVPANPRPYEPVFVRIGTDKPSEYWSPPTIRMEGGVLAVEFGTGLDLPSPVPRHSDYYAGRLPAGSYRLVSAQAGTAKSFVVEGASAAMTESSGHYWNPAEPGWGLSVIRGASASAFAVWFTYDATGKPAWYTVEPGGPTSPTEYSGNRYEGPILRASVPVTPSGPDYGRFAQEPVGTAVIQFTSGNDLLFIATIDGRTTQRSLRRLPVD